MAGMGESEIQLGERRGRDPKSSGSENELCSFLLFPLLPPKKILKSYYKVDVSLIFVTPLSRFDFYPPKDDSELFLIFDLSHSLRRRGLFIYQKYPEEFARNNYYLQNAPCE